MEMLRLFMKFIDLNQQYHNLKASIDARIQVVLDHGQYIMGPEVAELEEHLAELVGAKHCIAVSSGTTALQVALMAIDIQPGDEVITTPFSFFATAETIILLGAKPVFVDIDPKTYNIDPALIESAITSCTKAIIPVSLYGQCADLDPINAIAAKHGLTVIEDAAQSLGATYHGRHSCGLSTIATTSFFPSKPLGCYGDGGACFTHDDKLAHKMKSLRHHGEEGRYHHTSIGINARFDSIQAAVLLAKLDVFKEELAQRQQVAKWYDHHLKGQIITPYIEPFNVSAYAQYTIQLDDRDEIRLALKELGIPTAIHYPIPLNKQPIMSRYLDSSQEFPISEATSERVLSLPFHPYLTEQDVRKLTDDLLGLLSRQSVNA